MIIFRTERLVIRRLRKLDEELFTELLSKPEIINAIPQNSFSQDEIKQKFEQFFASTDKIEDQKINVWGIVEKEKSELIGLCLFLTNNENDRELGYRFRKAYWGKGYGTEIAKGIIDFGFKELNLQKITADVWVENKSSTKILEKFLIPVREFYNDRDKCMDRRYEISKENWQ